MENLLSMARTTELAVLDLRFAVQTMRLRHIRWVAIETRHPWHLDGIYLEQGGSWVPAPLHIVLHDSLAAASCAAVWATQQFSQKVSR